MNQTIVGHFPQSDRAHEALRKLEDAGFTSSDISYLSHGGTSSGSITEKGVAVGSVSGVLLGLASLAVPGIGPVFAAGHIAAALAGATVAGAAGGLLGALADLGVPEEHGHHWIHRLSKGGTLVMVRATDETADHAESALASAAADEVRRHQREVASSGGHDPADPHSAPANYGDEGGSSQWAQTVLRVEDDETEVAERTFSRDRGSERLD